MTKNELEKLNIQTVDGIFMPVYTFEEIKPIHEGDEIVDYEYTGFQIKMTAKENYNEWLKNKDKPPQLTEVEVLKKEKEALAKSVYELTEIVELIITGGVNQ